MSRSEGSVRAGAGTFAAGCCAERVNREGPEDTMIDSASGVGRSEWHVGAGGGAFAAGCCAERFDLD